MDALTLDEGQWNTLEKAYRLYKAHVMPFARTVLDDYFRKHSVSDSKIENTDELDAIISLCEACRKCPTNGYGDKDSGEMQSKQLDLFLEEESYTDLLNLLNQLFELREQYRLLHLKDNIKRNSGRWV